MVQLPYALTPDRRSCLVVRNLEIRKGRSTILSDFSWQHQPGAVAWIVGENGAGKSSLLRILARRERPRAGTVLHHGPRGTAPEILYYHPGMNLPDSMTVHEWQRFARMAAPPIGLLPLDPELVPPSVLAHKRVEHLSIGEAKRLILATLLQRAADFVILDEPFEHLAPNGKRLLAAHLDSRATTSTVIVSTNQEVPADAIGPILHFDGSRLEPAGNSRGIENGCVPLFG